MPAAKMEAGGASSPASRASAEMASQTTSGIASRDETTSVTRGSMYHSFLRLGHRPLDATAGRLPREVAQPDVETGDDQAHQRERRPDAGEAPEADVLPATIGDADRHHVGRGADQRGVPTKACPQRQRPPQRSHIGMRRQRSVIESSQFGEKEP